jgi:plastocyanin
MFIYRFGKPGLAGLSSALVLAAAVAGCGGQPTDSSDASVVLPSPDVRVVSKASVPGSTAAGSPGGATTTAPAAAAEAAPAASGGAGGWGTFKGQVVFDGAPPPAKVLQEKGKAEKNPEVCASDAPIVSERLVIDAASKGVKNVLVYFPRPTAVNEDAKKAVTGKTVTFDQKKCVFEPHVLGLMVGETVTLKSSDPVNHNVNVKLKQSTFNQTIAGGQSQVYPIAGAERTPGQVVCDIHPWMSAWWMVLDNPYIAVTDEKGNFEIKNVPAGAQKVVVWQEFVKGGGFLTAPSGEEISIKADDATVKEFKIDSSKLLPAN